VTLSRILLKEVVPVERRFKKQSHESLRAP
jgi:hypothetical protein